MATKTALWTLGNNYRTMKDQEMAHAFDLLGDLGLGYLSETADAAILLFEQA